MEGLDITNAQGNYDQGRGADGLSAFAWRGSRYGSGVPVSNRPARISGKPTPAPGLDPQYLLPRSIVGGALRIVRGTGTRMPYRAYPGGSRTFIERGPGPGFPIKSAGLIDPGQIPGVVTVTKITPAVRIARPTLRRRAPRSKAAKIRRRQQFINWLKNWSPKLYMRAKAKADAVEAKEGTLGQLGGWWETFTENLTEVGGAVLQYKTQKAILDAQLERMRAGLPPLQTSEYAPTVAVKVDPGTTREITGAIGAGFGKMLPFIAIGGLAIFLMMRRK